MKLRLLILLAGLIFSVIQPARGEKLDDRVVSDETYMLLRDHLGWDRSIDVFLNCIDRPSCENYMSTAGFRKFSENRQTPFEIDRYVTQSFDKATLLGFSLYYDQDGVDVGETLVVIDATVNPYEANSIRGVKRLVKNSFAEEDAGGGTLYWLGKIYISDGIWFKTMVHKGSAAENDYTLRYLISFTNYRNQISGLDDPFNQYFFDAVKVYTITDEISVRSAILAVGKVAASLQRQSMLLYLQEHIEVLRKEGDEYWIGVINNLQQLHDELASREWTMEDIVEEKMRLRALSPKLAQALDNSDGRIFRRLYPEFFPGQPLDD